MDPAEQVSSIFHMRMETDPVSCKFCSLEYQLMEKVQELTNPECYTSSPESFITEKREGVLESLRRKVNTVACFYKI
jgi:hypothetical protein